MYYNDVLEDTVLQIWIENCSYYKYGSRIVLQICHPTKIPKSGAKAKLAVLGGGGELI